VDSARSAPPPAPASLPERRESLSCQDLQTLFSQLDASSTFEFALPLSSALIAVLDDGIAERWQWSFMESKLLSKIHAGRNGDPSGSFAEFERWYNFDYGSFAEHIPGRIPRSPSRLVPAGCESVFQLCPLVDTLGGCSDPKGRRTEYGLTRIVSAA
jgi:hypothetical protein